MTAALREFRRGSALIGPGRNKTYKRFSVGVFYPAASHHFPPRWTSTYMAISENCLSLLADRSSRRTCAIATPGSGLMSCTTWYRDAGAAPAAMSQRCAALSDS